MLGFVSLMDCCRAAGTEGKVEDSGFPGVTAGAGVGLLGQVSSNTCRCGSYPLVGTDRAKT